MRHRVLLLIGLSGLFAPSFAQPTGTQLNSTDAKGRKQGDWSKTWSNGKTRYAGQFKDDRPVGTFKHYDEEGRLVTLQEHAGDGRTSRARHFHGNGTLMAQGKYLGQEKDSTWNYYCGDGKLRKVERYLNGKLNGEQMAYYADGSLAEQETWKNGVLEGPGKSWFPNGKVKSEVTYLAGEPEGRMTFYFLSGKKEIEGNMVNGDRDGTWYYFNEDGSVQLQVLYGKGQLLKERKENGSFKEYYDDEQLKSEVLYKKGKREGPFAEYHDNGRWELKQVSSDPVMGTPPDVERVLIGQTKKKEGVYVNDQLEGEVKEYDEKGKLVKSIRYVAGVEQGK
ncbi:MAG: hypothetical protein JNM62_00485 [Flavobacteriales bacterium]|nr:hypothetical protein [Flavobacteriales bacterium]